MKTNRVWMGAVTAALAVTVLTTGALAGWHHGRSGGGNGGTGVCANTACRYVDANGDGICDNRGTGACRTGACRYVDANGDVAQKYGIMSIPNVIVFKNGEPAANSLGYVPAAALKSFLEQNL